MYTGSRQASSGLKAAAATGTAATVRSTAQTGRPESRRGPFAFIGDQAGLSTKSAWRVVSLALSMTGRRNTVSKSPLS